MLPSETELLAYIKKEKLVNYTKIARRFKISNQTVPDLLQPLLNKKKIRIKKVGSYRFVEAIGKG